ncbi:MAG: ABC transporter permease [Cyclobacteriaceae bacterium]
MNHIWNKISRSDWYASVRLVRNSVSISFRNFFKQSLTIGATLGLALGFSCCLLIFSFISTELSFDKYHENSDRIYRIITELTLGDRPVMTASTNTAPAVFIKNESPAIVDGVRLLSMNRVPVKYELENKEFYEDRIIYADPSIFHVFSFPIVKGRPDIDLLNPNTVVLTETTASRYFGTKDPIGEVLRLNGIRNYEVVGVIKDIPENSHFKFDMVLSFSSLYEDTSRDAVESWYSSFMYYSYIRLKEGQKAEEVESQLNQLADIHFNGPKKWGDFHAQYFLQPMTDIHLHSDLRHEIATQGDIKHIYIFGAIGILVLIIASMNFVNLITARFTKRIDDVVIRKILGADRGVLVSGFLVESIGLCTIALAVAVVLTLLALPAFSDISQRSLNLDISQHPYLPHVLIFLTFGIGLLAGSYPAVFLSSWKPAQFLSKARLRVGKAGMRRALVVVQFAISIFLIIATALIFQQREFLMTRNLGFDKEHILIVPLLSNEVKNNTETIKEKLAHVPGVRSVSATSHIMAQTRSGGLYEPEGMEAVMMDGMSIDYDYLNTMGMEMAQGRNFSRDFPSDAEDAVLINEVAAKKLGWTDAVGKKITSAGRENPKTIVGVVKDFFYKSPHIGHEPIYISLNERQYRSIVIKLGPGDLQHTIDGIKIEWKSIDPDRSLDYYFLDDFYDKQFHAEQQMSSIFSYLTIFAQLIACLGLAGMASFIAESRTKEIGIRKVIGASAFNIITLLSRSNLTTLLLAFLIGGPIAYLSVDRWLQNFNYRIEIGPEVFVVAGIVSCALGLATVVLQSLRAAWANPVESLRSE